MTKCMRNFALLMTIAMVASLPAVAQQAGLTGTVSDPTGAVIPGAAVTLTHKGTGASRTTTTGARGGYLIPQLEPGQYRLEISMQGFKTVVRDPVTLPVGITSALNATMEIGDVTEQVVVEEGTTAINIVDASLGSAISGTQVLSLPSQDLDPAGLLSLQPGVTYFPSAAEESGGYSNIRDDDGRGGTVNGARSDQTNITLDGVDVNDAENGFAFVSVLRATQASLAEFRVTTSNYNADQGRSAGGQVQLVTKSGTNDLHGMAYYTHRNEAFAANDFFNNRSGVEKGELRRHIYGGALGGPIVKDRLFIFGNIERLEHSEAQTVLRTVPSDSFRDGVLIYECADPALCPGGTVSGLSGTHSVQAGFHGLTPAELAAIDPLGFGPNSNVISYLAGFPAANDSGDFDGINLVGFRFNSPIENTFNTYIARVDFNIDTAGKHTLFGRGTLHDDAVVRTTATYPGQSPAQLGLGNSRGIALGYNAALSPTLVNTLRYGYTRLGEKNAGVRNSEFSGLRFINDLSGFDRANTSTNTRQLPAHHLRNSSSWTSGTHTISFGIDFRFTRNNRSSNANSFNEFNANPSWMPNVGRNVTPGTFECGQADPTSIAGCDAVPAVAGGFQGSFRDTVINMLGITSQVDGNFNFLSDGTVLASGDPVLRRFAVDEYEGYIQDRWRMTPALTLTYGVRYYLSSPPWETNGQQVSPTPGLSTWFEARRALMLAGLPTNQAPQIRFDLAGPANNGADYYPWDKNDWSPRIALAWAPKNLGWFSGNGKLVIRGGFSLVYDRLGNGIICSFDRAGSFGMSTEITSTFAGCDEGFGTAPLGSCPRFLGEFDTSAATAQLLPAAPPGGFPAVPPGSDGAGGLLPGAFAISTALDSGIKTPFARVFNLSVARELPGGITVEGTYVGRRGRGLLIGRDLAMPADPVDPASGQSYFQVSQAFAAMFEAGVDVNSVAPMPFWENFFPSWGPGGINGGSLVCGVVPGSTGAAGFSATQVAYDWVSCLFGDTTVVPWCVDVCGGGGGFPGYALGGPGDPDLDGDGLPDNQFFFFNDQFATLNAWSSIARSEYHAFQLTVRKGPGHGIQFGLNYTLSHALDHSSDPERLSPSSGGNGFGGFSGSTINAWDVDLEYANADFDLRHAVNANYIWDLPFGQGRALGSGIPSWANQLIGDWQVSGVVRYNSGQAINIFNGRVWATNWNLSGNAVCAPVGTLATGLSTGSCPATQNVKNGAGDVGPNLFTDPAEAITHFRHSAAGERGGRNQMRGDDYYNLDLAIAKSFPLPMEGHRLNFRWEMFNLTNSVYFNAGELQANILRPGTFGNYTGVLGAPRRMQVSLRYEF